MVVEVYNLHQHTECVLIYIGKNETTVVNCPTSNKYFKNTNYKRSSESACITYNRQKTKVLDWGDSNYAANNQDCIEINNFMDRLYSLFKKGGKNTRDEEDIFLVEAVSDFLRLKMAKLIEESEKMIESLDTLHYIFVVSSDWEDEIREQLLRPIFIQSGLISIDDHKDRLLFHTDLECIFYYMQQEILLVGDILTESFRKQRYNIMCRVTSLNSDTLSIQLDLIETQHSLYDFSDTMLYPRVVCSSGFSITADEIKKGIKEFLERNMFPGGTNNIVQNELICRLTSHVYFSIVRQMYKYYKNKYKGYNGLMKPWITDTKRWELNEIQDKFIRSICVFDICKEIGKTFLNTMSNLLSIGFRKNYKLLVVKDMYSFKPNFHPSLFAWFNAILECNRNRLSYTIMTTKKNTRVWSFYSTHIIKGAAVTAFEAIRNSEIYSKPSVLSKNMMNSSIFLNENPSAIFNIDISLESTLLSYSIVGEDGLVKKTYDNNYFVANKCLPSLGSFYKVSNVTNLNIDEQFISIIVKNYLNDGLNLLSRKPKDFLHKFENIMNKEYSEDTPIISLQQHKFIIIFLLMYLIYIKELIVNSKLLIAEDIGYVVSIEKKLLDSVLGSKIEFEKILLASRLITNKSKLKLITQGESDLSTIQNFWKLEFSLKSCYVLTQLHENYVQLTLYQIVTVDTEQQETIILKDEIIPIQNIYDTLCTFMWNHITENNQAIQLCDIHFGSNKDQFLELFSLSTKANYCTIVRLFILENILKKKGNLNMSDKKTIYLNSNCNCKIHLSIIDVLDIAFKPTLRHIASLISAPLMNTDYFGNYKDILYLFSMIYFNENPQFQIILADMLKEELDGFNEGQEIETTCLVIPELPSLLSKSTINQLPYMCKTFQSGNLRQVSSANYGFTITQYTDNDVSISRKPVYKDKRTDKASILCEDIAFTLLKKGDMITDCVFERVFYLKKQSDSTEEVVAIELLKFKEFNGLKPNGTVPLEGNVYKALDYFSFDLKLRNYRKDSDLPIMISIKSKGYSSSLEFSVKEVGQDKKSDGLCFVEIGEPMTLIRC